MGDAQNFNHSMGNYKGLMLCNRPNEEIRIEIERPFISRVDPKDRLGLNKQREPPRVKPIKSNQRVLDVLSRHKLWLQDFKRKVRDDKDIKQLQQDQKTNKQIKLREKALENIDQFKNRNSLLKLGDDNIAPEVTQEKAAQILNNSIDNYEDPQEDIYYNNNNPVQEQSVQQQVQPKSQISPSKNKKNKSKKQKPEWAYTQEQIENKEDEEVDDLLNFVNNLDYEQYVDDFEVKNMMATLKNRIDTIVSKHENLEQAEQEYINNNNNQNKSVNFNSKQYNNDYQHDIDNECDRKSVRSGMSKQSITSMRQEAREKEKTQKKDWDNSTTCGDRKKISVEDRLVKHIADEILSNNRYLRNIHSHNSIRTLLENEAHRQFKQQQQQDSKVSL